MRTGPIDFRPEPLHSPDAQSLILALNAELRGRYPEAGATHFRLDPEEVAPGRGVFLVGRSGGEPVSCGALRTLDDGNGELKRMYVVPSWRGQGVGRALLDALASQARALGLSRLLLETGVRQPEAIALYSRYGFQRVDPFREYVWSPLSVCMAMDLPESS